MKTQLKSLFSSFFIAAGCISCQSHTTLTTVASVDLQLYAGTWYEIASYPQFFERGCINVKATYTIKPGYIEVFNESIKDHKINDIKGKAFVVKNCGNAKLKVQFFWPFKGDYWVIYLADDYSWSIVSDPDRSTLWILSRAKTMDGILYDALIYKLTKNGFDSSKIVKMKQE